VSARAYHSAADSFPSSSLSFPSSPSPHAHRVPAFITVTVCLLLKAAMSTGDPQIPSFPVPPICTSSSLWVWLPRLTHLPIHISRPTVKHQSSLRRDPHGPPSWHAIPQISPCLPFCAPPRLPVTVPQLPKLFPIALSRQRCAFSRLTP